LYSNGSGPNGIEKDKQKHGMLKTKIKTKNIQEVKRQARDNRRKNI
jgi:hypothetical protein